MSLRLATLNLFSGRSLSDGLVDPDRIAAAVAALDADVLALQEVDDGQPRSGGHDQAALVARATGAVDHRFVPLVTGTPGVPGWRPAARHDRPADGGQPDRTGPGDRPYRVDVDPGGAPRYGIALVSRRPVRAWHVLHLEPARGRWPIVIPARPPRVLWLADEPRAVIAAELDDPPVIVAGTHLSFVPGVNVRQLRRARRWLADLAGPRRALVLMGDLNLPGSLPARITGWTPLVTGPTFPGPAPRVQIDHILTSAPSRPSPLRAEGRVLDLPVGDHRAALVDLDL